MGKVISRSTARSPSEARRRLNRLQDRYHRLSLQLAQVDAAILKLRRNGSGRRPLTTAALDKLLHELTAGLPDLPPLPADFSRADLYLDHD